VPFGAARASMTKCRSGATIGWAANASQADRLGSADTTLWGFSMASAGSPRRYVRPGWFTQHVFNPLVAMLTRSGVSVGSRELRVRGREQFSEDGESRERALVGSFSR
jgi:hypothetical protein